MRVLITGGAGYIGSHAALRLVRDGHHVAVIDNLFRGHRAAVDAIAAVTGKPLLFLAADIGDYDAVRTFAAEHRFDTVLHFAARAYVGESVEDPLAYYRANTAAPVTMLQALHDAGTVSRFVFSSTCATYGEPGPGDVPLRETLHQRPINPYGASKLFLERVLIDHAAACAVRGTPFAVAMLRYFNVAGCDRSGVLGEHHEPETHLVPIVLQCLLGRRPAYDNTVTIFGADYPTPDGTCIRDYVHVDDLIDAHVRVCNALQPGQVRAYNIGIGRGYSVLQVIAAAERVAGRKVAVRHGPRRPGDPAELFADPTRIRTELGWNAQVTSLDDIVASAWAWMKAHPGGYAKAGD